MSNERKAKLLGQPFGTASNKLRKSILFMLLQETNKDICYRCGEKITDINKLSIEHIENWMSAENPVESFFDLENISFSHLSCNSSVSHPTQQGENHHSSKLKEDDVLEIRSLLGEGYTQKEIAKKYNISRETISHIKNKTRWQSFN